MNPDHISASQYFSIYKLPTQTWHVQIFSKFVFFVFKVNPLLFCFGPHIPLLFPLVRGLSCIRVMETFDNVSFRMSLLQKDKKRINIMLKT